MGLPAEVVRLARVVVGFQPRRGATRAQRVDLQQLARAVPAGDRGRRARGVGLTRGAETGEPGDPGPCAGGTAVVLAELAADVPDRRGGALAEGALPRVRVEDDRLPLLRIAAGSPGRRAGAI